MTIDPNSESDLTGRDKIRSAWSIWLHPSRSRREMGELQEEVVTLQDLLNRTDRDRTRLIEEVSQKNEDIRRISENARQDTDQLKASISELKEANAELSQEINEWRQTRIELDALEEQLKEWEDIKAKYEERIKMLTLRLRDALGHRSPLSATELDSDIIEEGENPYLTPEEREAMQKRKAETDIATRLLSDMFPDDQPLDMTAPASDLPTPAESLGSSPSASTSTTQSASYKSQPTSSYVSTRQPSGQIPGKPRLPIDDTDWLITLPPE